MNKGRFITLEGGEGAGKSTQARLLCDALNARGVEVLLTREPGGTPGAEQIRELLLHHSGEGLAEEGPAEEGWGPAAEALLFAAARADHVARAIRPALETGTWVICDRFIDSSRAYQGGAGGLSDEDILTLHRIGSGNLLPDLTLLIEIDPAVAAIRLSQRDGATSDRIGGRGEAYHADVARSFDKFAAAETQRFVRIRGEGSPAEIHALIMQAAERLWTPQR